MNYKALDEALRFLNGENDSILIGTIDFVSAEQLLDEAKIGEINFGASKGNCEVKVLMREGTNYPHFHIESTKGATESICIAIYRAEYYKHAHGTATLNSGEIKLLNKWLDKKSKRKIKVVNNDGNVETRELTNWQNISLSYDQANGTNYFNINNSRPEYYSSMPDMKDSGK